MNDQKLCIRPLPCSFSIYKTSHDTDISFDHPFVFYANTDEERSVLCPDEIEIRNAYAAEKGYRGLRIEGQLDFALVGILADLTALLADHKIPVLAFSTFNTDYVFVKKENFQTALHALRNNGYDVKE